MDQPCANPPDQPAQDNDVLRLLRDRGAVRGYRPDPIPESWLNTLLAAGQRAPTSSNIQACSIVVVRDEQAKRRLAELAGNQQHIIDCPVYLALCADLTRAEHACRLHGTEFQGHTLEIGLVASIDAALVGMTISLAAESMGLGSVMIGGMRNHPLEVAELLGLPPRAYVVFGLCLGFPVKPPIPKPRVPLAAFVHHERYDAATRDVALDEYDQTLARYYREQGRETPDQSWTRTIAGSFSVARRKQLREQLRTLGFPLE